MKKSGFHNTFRFKLLVLLLVLAGVITSCSTEKDTFVNRSYHNITSHYNGYFNARESFREGVEKLKQSHHDDYENLLPVFVYGDEAASKNVYPEMDRAIKKCSKVIDRHSMYIRKKERNKWIDDCYLLIGKSKFYKKEFVEAYQNFDYIARAFPDNPTRFRALMWMVRTKMEMGQIDKAENLIDFIKEERGFPEEMKGEFYAIETDFLIRKGKYQEAAEMLQNAIGRTNKKEKRTRYTYLLAQLYHKINDYSNATRYYSTVIKMKPRQYVMEFNARINRAKAFDISRNTSEVKDELHKMLKDEKNIEYRDQIYFALAELAFREGETEKALDYLKKSASSSVNNNKQKAQAYLRLADYYFLQTEYIRAQAYYDSTQTVMSKEHADFYRVKERNESLSKLVENVKIINEQDSLLRVANMDEKERRKLIRGIIKDLKEKREREEEELARAENFNTNNSQNPFDNGGGGSGKWYFYNPTTKGFGFSDFKRQWGDRKLEDNWRRSSKKTLAPTVQEEVPDTAAGSKGLSDTDEKYYLNKLPLEEEEQRAAHQEKIEALYDLGTIYKEEFEDYDKAIDNFEMLVNNYDTSRFYLPSLYQIYRISLTIDDKERMKKYKEIILSEYPNSEYARIIKDPSYMRVTRENKKRVENYYSIIYDLYKAEKYEKVLIRCEKAGSIFPENHIEHQFDMLEALAIGQTMSTDTFKIALQGIVKKYPEKKVSKRAREILDLIEKNKGNLKSVEEKQKEAPKVEYDHNSSDQHVFVLIFPNEDGNAGDLKIDVSDFNKKFFSMKKLNVSNVFLDPATQMISVRTFPNEEESMKYYRAFKANKKGLKLVHENDYQYFVMTTDNFAKFYQSKNVADYIKYFEKKYLNK